MVIDDVSFLLNSFFDFFLPVLLSCAVVYAIVIIFRRLTGV